MKKIIFVSLFLLSATTWAADVCLIQMDSYSYQTQISCKDQPFHQVTKGKISAAEPLSEKLSKGYKIVDVEGNEHSILYTLVRN